MTSFNRSLWWRNAFFTVLQPGMVAIAIPIWIVGHVPHLHSWTAYSWLGLALLLTGTAVTLWCIHSFATRGNGTLSPADPTRKLVVSGLYRYSRNPMYVGVTLMLLGDCFILQSQGAWIYSGLVFVAFNIFILGFEEPRLRRDFREEYKIYCNQVRRWL
jgi:protein-S-isoprenylcysteine O-methyltransferase Ste14